MALSILDARTKFIQLALKYGFVFLDGIPQWIEACTYSKYSLVRVDDAVYVSKVDSNLGHTPSGVDAYWGGDLTFKGRIQDQTGFVTPVGAGLQWFNATAPAGFLFQDGASYAKASYSDLFGIIGYTFGGSGDNFNVPDMREAAPIGVGTRSSGVTEHDSFTLGQFKDDQIQTHVHKLIFDVGEIINGCVVGAGGTYGQFAYGEGTPNGTNIPQPPTEFQSNGTPRTGKTTHGKGFGCHWIIKY